MVEVTGLGKSFGSRRVLDEVSFSVRPGELVGLLGPNGAGKTTTLSILATVLNPDQGEVTIAGLDLATQRAAIRARLGLVPQSLALYPTLTARENLLLFARLRGATAREARRTCAEVLDEVGLTEHAQRTVGLLSGGMKRRLNLACALVHRPQVLLLDEPTVGVDPQSRERILSIIKELGQNGTAVLYCTHYMDEVERVCSRVVLIDHGRVVASGTTAELVGLAGARPRIELYFQSPPPRNWYLGLPEVSELTPAPSRNHSVLEFDSLPRVQELLNRAQAVGSVLEFTVHSPNLSDAFMALTGHQLRDEHESG